MRIYLYMISIFFFRTPLAIAQEYFVHSPQMNAGKFSEWILQNQKNEFKNFFIGKNSLQNLNRLPISADVRSLRKSIEMLDQQPMLATEVESSIFLYQKIGLENLTKKEKRRFLGLITSTEAALTQHANELQKLSEELSHRDPTDPAQWLNSSDFADLTNYLNSPESSVIVDGVSLKSSEKSNMPRVSRQIHQWLYISNSSYPILYVGDFSNFIDQLSALKPMSNQCGEEFIPWEGLPNLKLKNLGTTGDCFSNAGFLDRSDTRVSQLNESSQHREKMEAWALPMVIIGSGLALSYFRNKEITFHTPNLKF